MEIWNKFLIKKKLFFLERESTNGNPDMLKTNYVDGIAKCFVSVSETL